VLVTTAPTAVEDETTAEYWPLGTLTYAGMYNSIDPPIGAINGLPFAVVVMEISNVPSSSYKSTARLAALAGSKFWILIPDAQSPAGKA